MKTIAALLIIVVVFATGPAAAGDAFRAGYELKLHADGSDGHIRTMGGLSESNPIVESFGDYKVAISIMNVLLPEFVLRITVQKVGATLTGEYLLDQSLKGRVERPLEFDLEAGGTRVEGAISVGRVNS